MNILIIFTLMLCLILLGLMAQTLYIETIKPIIGLLRKPKKQLDNEDTERAVIRYKYRKNGLKSVK